METNKASAAGGVLGACVRLIFCVMQLLASHFSFDLERDIVYKPPLSDFSKVDSSLGYHP